MRTIGKIDRAMLDQNIEYHDRILDLEEALRIIARKKKMDACAAISMRAIAIAALTPADGKTT